MGPGREALDGNRGRGNQRQGRHRRRADRADLLRHQTLEAEALKAISRLVERDKVLAVVGPCFSGPFETIAPQLDARFKTPINSYCSAKPGLSAMSKWAFRNTLTSDKQLKPVVDAWLKEYKIKKVVIIYDAEDAVSKGEGAACCPRCSRSTVSRCSTV